MTPAEHCLWTEDDEGESWNTLCGERFQFLADGPAENSFRFCPYCGGVLYTPGDREPWLELPF